MRIEVTPITYADIPAAARSIQVAFEGDPYANWAFDKRPGKFNVQRNLASLRAKCEWGIRNALFYVAKHVSDDDDGGNDGPKVVGISMWMPPHPADQPQSWSAWFDEYILWFKQGWNIIRYGGHGGLRVHRYWIWKARQAEVQRQIWNDPHGYYFCNIVSVLPEYQGKGVGKDLMTIVMDRADREGRRCYLESSRWEPNVKIYQKMGFEVVKSMRCEDQGEGCDLYCMMREPQPPKDRETRTGTTIVEARA